MKNLINSHNSKFFKKQNGDEDYDYRYLRNNCINLKDAI